MGMDAKIINVRECTQGRKRKAEALDILKAALHTGKRSIEHYAKKILFHLSEYLIF